MASPKSSRPAPSRFGRHKGLLTTLIILGVLIMAAVIAIAIIHERHQKALAVDRARFAQADRDIQTLGSFIRVATHPTKEKFDKNCRYISAEFGPKDLVCQTNYLSSYSVSNYQQANSLVQSYKDEITESKSAFKFEKVTGSSLQSSDSMSIDPFISNSNKGLKEQILTEVYALSNSVITCAATYTYASAENAQVYLTDMATNGAYTMGVTMSCGDKALQPYFKLEN